MKSNMRADRRKIGGRHHGRARPRPETAVNRHAQGPLQQPYRAHAAPVDGIIEQQQRDRRRLISKVAMALNRNVSGALVYLQRISILILLLVVSGCTGKPDSVDPVRPFDVHRYKGEWFEIMRLDHSFERGLTNVTATYTLRDDGSVGVLNRGFDRKTCRWKEANGRAVFQGAGDTASLSVTFFWPFAGGYHVFALDQQDYGWALISGPSRNYLWILARQPHLSADLRGRLVDQARRLGFPVDDLILVDHGEPACASDQASSK